MSKPTKVKEVPAVANDAVTLSANASRVNQLDCRLVGGFSGAALLHTKYRSSGPVLEFGESLLDVQNGVSKLQDLCYTLSKNAGWHHRNARPGDIGNEQFCVKLALIHSELSEALEGKRCDKKDNHLPHRSSVEVELADAVIRIMDLAGAMGLDLSGAVMEKLQYNQRREDHTLEVRGGENGKRF